MTGCSGLVGSEAVLFFAEQGWAVTGIDNNMRRSFFGVDGDTSLHCAAQPSHDRAQLDQMLDELAAQASAQPLCA
jgi:nucleoside-diphosphate-sugar epimerase